MRRPSDPEAAPQSVGGVSPGPSKSRRNRWEPPPRAPWRGGSTTTPLAYDEQGRVTRHLIDAAFLAALRSALADGTGDWRTMVRAWTQPWETENDLTDTDLSDADLTDAVLVAARTERAARAPFVPSGTPGTAVSQSVSAVRSQRQTKRRSALR
ncbi:hypothetical protein [Streptomyces sp. NPDC096068]|uniref:hypothetical protein n=1 Tax=Streptomyces sp. NPDC096068 TaxID=3155424 RepID=UPI0033222C9A